MSKYISVPLVGAIIWILVVKGNYKIAEKVFLIFSLSLLVYVVSAIMGKPHWGEIGKAIIKPEMKMNTTTLTMVLGIVGTTIAPWMQFYMQASVIEKGLKIKHYKFVMIDIIVGCVATVVVAFFIMVACASNLHDNGIVINEAKDAAMALKPLAGNISSLVFAFGLFIASIFQQPFFRWQPLFMYVKPLALKPVLIKNGMRHLNFIIYIPSFSFLLFALFYYPMHH